MENLKTALPTVWEAAPEPFSIDPSFLRKRYNAFADSQKSSHTLWFLLSLMIHGIFLVPMIGMLTYFYTGPGYIFLTISLLCFFTSMIENMGGSGIRSTLLCFAVSFIIHIIMAVIMLF
jgi:hypothetical protein